MHRAGVCECGSHGLAERRCGVGWARNAEAGRGERHTVEAFKILNEKKRNIYTFTYLQLHPNRRLSSRPL